MYGHPAPLLLDGYEAESDHHAVCLMHDRRSIDVDILIIIIDSAKPSSFRSKFSSFLRPSLIAQGNFLACLLVASFSLVYAPFMNIPFFG